MTLADRNKMANGLSATNFQLAQFANDDPRVTDQPLSKSPRPGATLGAVFAGSSGWAYPKWKPAFYPPKIPAKRFLEHYASRLNSVEVNYTFRQLPTRATIDGWLAQVGDEFRFSFKAPQRITHLQRLKNSAESLASLFTALMPVAGAGRMGVILLQLPPNFKADNDRLGAFLEDAKRLGSLRLAFEFRHPSWFCEETYESLARNNTALCIAESDELETPEVSTAAFSYYRLRKSVYGRNKLCDIERRLQASAARGDVFAYFKHEESPDGALYAEALLERLRAE